MLVEIQVVILLKQLYIEEGEQVTREWLRTTGFNERRYTETNCLK